ncbi:MAG TPA: acetyl-CoA C-acyltransferase [Acidimicrobiales bacterium]|jgi:acetyl-CoA C-acetyltransferase|nr:acetyl-CoA C-acyltransferase [Acidimicrobiales bacterium]
MPDSVVLAGARTPIGKLSGALGARRASELGAVAIAEALHRAGVAPDAVDYVVMGQVLQAGQGQNPARQAAIAAGIPMSVPAATLNKVCLSGLNAIQHARLLIAAGEADVVVAGGMESMTNAPHLLAAGRRGLRFGSGELEDAIMADGLTCAFGHQSMGAATEQDAAAAGIGRERQDAIALASHERAAAAQKEGRLAEEIVPVHLEGRAGTVEVRDDEGIRPDTTLASLAALKPAFAAGGSITAGNASQISDGAAALVVASTDAAARLGVQPLAELLAYGQVAGPDTSLLTQPSRAVRAALGRAGMTLAQVDLFEINEAFAAVSAASIADLGVPDDVVNVNGGAIALGHPIGMSGARLALTLAYELRRRGGGVGAAALCGGGGQGDALLLRVA